jgi:hypothetical protein
MPLDGGCQDGGVDVRRMTLLIAAVAVACAGLGLWLGTTIADDTGSIVLVVAGCAVLGSFAPTAFRWIARARRLAGLGRRLGRRGQ